MHPRRHEILEANTDKPLAPDPDYSGLRVAPPLAVWMATAIEKVINTALWVVDTLLRGI